MIDHKLNMIQFEIMFPIRSDKTVIRIMILNPDSDSGKSNAPLDLYVRLNTKH